MPEVFDVSMIDADTLTKLRTAFVASLGVERGMEALSEALLWACEHPKPLAALKNPAGYLYRVGQSHTRPKLTRVEFPPPSDSGDYSFEPKLASGLALLSGPQRVAVVLVRGYGMSMREVGELTGRRIPTIQRHLERGLQKLRTHLGVNP